MAKIEDAEIDNYDNESLQSDNESGDDILPITTKKYTGKKKRRVRKRSVSLPFIEDHGLSKGLVAVKGLQLGIQETEWKRNEWEDDSDAMTERGNSINDQGPTRRSTSMPEFYQFSQRRKDETCKQYTRNGLASRQRSTLAAAETGVKEEESFKLPVISSSIQSSRSSRDQTENDLEALSQSAGNMKIQRKTYLPRINSNNGSIFMKSR